MIQDSSSRTSLSAKLSYLTEIYRGLAFPTGDIAGPSLSNEVTEGPGQAKSITAEGTERWTFFLLVEPSGIVNGQNRTILSASAWAAYRLDGTRSDQRQPLMQS